MICQNCKKPLSKTVPKEVKFKAIALYNQGYSCRDISSLLGGAISFSTVSRVILERSRRLKEAKRKKG